MINIFKDWISIQGQIQKNDQIQGRELEQKYRQDLKFLSNTKDRQKTINIMKEVQKSKLPKFISQDRGSKVEAWVIGVKRALSFKAYTSREKAQIEMSLLTGEALLWWVNEEMKMQVTPLESYLGNV